MKTLSESDQAINSRMDQNVPSDDNVIAKDKEIIDEELNGLKKILERLKPLLKSQHPNCLPYIHMCEFNLEQLYKQVADSPNATEVESIEQPSETPEDRQTEIFQQVNLDVSFEIF